MTLTQLEYFCALAKTGQYTRAAQELNVSQPSISYAISELEAELGVPLTEKRNRTIALTPCGEFFLGYAKRAIDTLDEGVKMTRQMIDPQKGTVSLGYFYSISDHFIPDIVETFFKSNTDYSITFKFSQYNNRDILNELKRGNVDLAFCVAPDDEVEYAEIARQKLYVAVHEGHRLAKKEGVALSELANEPMVVLEQSSGLRKTVEQLFDDNKVPKNIAFETQECTSALQSIVFNRAVSIMPRIPLMQLQPIAVIPLVEPDYSRPVYLAWRRGEKLLPPAKRVRDYILNSYHANDAPQ